MSTLRIIKMGLSIAGAAMGAWYLYKNGKKEEEQKQPTDKTNQETVPTPSKITYEEVIDITNEISETMIIIFEQLGIEAVQLTQTGISDNEINKKIADKFRKTKNIAERQICEQHGYSHEEYITGVNYFVSFVHLPELRKALYPCNYLLSILEDTPMEQPNLGGNLTEKHVILLNNAIFELSCRCIDKIQKELCEQMQCNKIQFQKLVRENESLRNEVFDIIIDAEKQSKLKILKDEDITVADMLIASLLYRNSDTYRNAMEAIESKRQYIFKEFGLNFLVC